MKSELEIERRFLLKGKLPLLTGVETTQLRIGQVYIKPAVENAVERVRFVSDYDNWTYFHTQKQPAKVGVLENEREISVEEYKLLLLHRLEGSRNILKTRTKIKYFDHTLEIDEFGAELNGLKILEVELKSFEESIFLPVLLPIVAEITKDKSLSNYSLATNDISYLKWRLNQYL